MEAKLTPKNIKLIYRKLKALNELTKHLGIVNSDDVDKDLVMFLFDMIHSDLPLYRIVAIRHLLDYFYPEWIKFASKRVVGIITDRNDKSVSKWKKDVIVGYEHKCANCGDSKNLQAHHILPWSSFPEARIDLDNGICLCGDCHSKEHPQLSSKMFVQGLK